MFFLVFILSFRSRAHCGNSHPPCNHGRGRGPRCRLPGRGRCGRGGGRPGRRGRGRGCVFFFFPICSRIGLPSHTPPGARGWANSAHPPRRVTKCRVHDLGRYGARPSPVLAPTNPFTAPPDSDDDDGGGGGPAGPGGADGDGDEAMDGGDGGPPLDIDDLSIHSFDGHTGEGRERRGARRRPPLSLSRKKRKLMRKKPFPLKIDAVFAVAFNPAHPTVVATGGGDDRAFLFQVSVTGAPLREQRARAGLHPALFFLLTPAFFSLSLSLSSGRLRGRHRRARRPHRHRLLPRLLR